MILSKLKMSRNLCQKHENLFEFIEKEKYRDALNAFNTHAETVENKQLDCFLLLIFLPGAS